VEAKKPKRPAPSFTLGLLIKLLFLAAVNGLTLAALPRMIDQHVWFGMTAVLLATLAIDVVYLSKRFLPAKYLLPATIMLLVFQVYPVFYTFYVSFTNYSTSHNLTKEQALAQILKNSEIAKPDAPRYFVKFLVNDAGELAFLLTDQEGNPFLGTKAGLQPLQPTDIATDANNQVSVKGFHQVGLAEAASRQDEFLAITVPTPEGTIKLNPQNITQASLTERTLRYDPEANTMTNIQTGVVFHEKDGSYVSDSGEALNPGWRVLIGPRNFTKVFTSPAIRGPFMRAFIWNYIFATTTVFLQFALGLLIALALAHSKLRGKRLYRSLLVIPFAIPSYLTSLVWAGLLNTNFGAVNRLFHTNVDWLGQPTTAKISVLLVTMWLGFPYFFLVSTGALTAIPAELTEAAAVDGASGFYAFRSVKFPLLMITLAPLLISSFAFNFNNFNAIYLLTRGGPPIQGAQTPVGHTDILITYTYRLAFESGRGSQYGFAAAISVLIFVMVMAISIYSFRATKTLEQVR
jgi:arabinogalactan oligomer/maltooligosaccharide transport system permease protein